MALISADAALDAAPALNPDDWVVFAESGNQQRLTLHTGETVQGWVMELTETHVLISTGEGERGQDRWVALDAIDLASLAFFDPDAQTWRAFVAG